MGFIQMLIKFQLLLVLLALQNAGNKNAMALQVKVNGSPVSVRNLPQLEDLMQSGFGGGLDYIENTRTYDNVRYAYTKPFVLRFTDRFNVRWEVTIHRRTDRVSFVIPCGTEMWWYGDDTVRTGSDAQTNFAMVTFYWKNGGLFHSDGIRIAFQAYKWRNLGEALIDTQRWNNIMDNVVKGIDAATSVAEVASAAYIAG